MPARWHHAIQRIRKAYNSERVSDCAYNPQKIRKQLNSVKSTKDQETTQFCKSNRKVLQSWSMSRTGLYRSIPIYWKT